MQAVFLEAANYDDPVELAAILDREECMGDPELRKRIEALLKAHDRSDEDRSFFLRCYWDPEPVRGIPALTCPGITSL